jgi:hypothetical protein
MTSKDPEIQEIYNEIKSYESRKWAECRCMEKCKRCIDTVNLAYEKSALPTANELENLIKRLTGVLYGFSSKPMKWDRPFVSITQTLPYSDYSYHILFIEYGINVVMTRDMLKKIPILNSIILKENGNDKPIRLNYLDTKLNKIFKGPYMYITKLDPHSLLFGTPPEDYQMNMNLNRTDTGHPINFKEKWFKYNNLAEALLNENWYT